MTLAQSLQTLELCRVKVISDRQRHGAGHSLFRVSGGRPLDDAPKRLSTTPRRWKQLDLRRR